MVVKDARHRRHWQAPVVWSQCKCLRECSTGRQWPQGGRENVVERAQSLHELHASATGLRAVLRAMESVSKEWYERHSRTYSSEHVSPQLFNTLTTTPSFFSERLGC